MSRFWKWELILCCSLGTGALAADRDIVFGRDILPILSDKCFHCHGPDAASRKAKLQLNTFDTATARRKRGRFAIVPGNPKRSLLWHRVTTDDPLDHMPPPESGKTLLTLSEQALIRAWIEHGAEYDTHWSLTPLDSPMPPAVSDEDWPHNPIDRFILTRLEARGRVPKQAADPSTRCRRLFLDITGLPPTPKELDAFLDDPSPHAWNNLVARLLNEEPYASRYAEHMATPWLDLARYADTCGIHMDNGRAAWPWRDWVLHAFRSNMPLDQFITEQLAGDLIENATTNQLIASGFNRNHVTSDEGGAIEEEYLFEYAVDRTNTFGTTFLGLTVNCAQCHDHKYDPITSADYYSLLAFFNNNDEPGVYSQTQNPDRSYEPFIAILTPEEKARLKALEDEVSESLSQRSQVTPEGRAAREAFQAETQSSWTWSQPSLRGAGTSPDTTFAALPDGSLLASGDTPDTDTYTITVHTDRTDLRAIALELLQHDSLPKGGPGRAANGNLVLTGIEGEVVSATDSTQRAPLALTWAWADLEQPNGDFAAVNALRADDGRGWAINAHQERGDRVGIFLASEPFGYPEGTDITLRLHFSSPYAAHSAGRFRLQLGSADTESVAMLPTAHSNWYITGPFAAEDGPEAYDTVYGPEAGGPLDFEASYRGDTWRHAPGVLEAELVTLAQGKGAEFVARELFAPTARRMELSMGSDDGMQIYLNGRRVHEARVDRGVAADQERVVLNLPAGPSTLVCKFVNTGGAGGMYHRELLEDHRLNGDLVSMALPASARPTERTRRAADAWRLQFSPRYRELTSEIGHARAAARSIREAAPTTMVMRDRAEPKQTYVMTRGLYDGADETRPVTPGVPAVLGHIEAKNPTRLDLANWIVGDVNPLTARVVANRLWQQFFGTGIAATVENVGLQGSWPSHPALLDWLAAELRRDWDLKKLIRTIVESATYQQAAAGPEDAPHLYAGFPRQRLTAEQIRDQALHVSGLLVEQLGGPSVKPYQPDGLWKEVAMLQSNTNAFEQGTQDDLWRRSMYTYWKRAAPPPSLLTFDAPTREFCVARRLTTDTPLQTLVLWNDPQIIEAARNTAARVLALPGTSQEQIAHLYRRCTGEDPPPDVARLLDSSLQHWRNRYLNASDDAASLVGIGASPIPDNVSAEELAAWTMLTSAVLSSDAAIVKD